MERLQVTLFGSLAFTGRGHGTDKAVMLGLSGELPDQVDPDHIDDIVQEHSKQRSYQAGRSLQISFSEKTDLLFNKRETLPHHTNGMRFKAFDKSGEALLQRDYYSVGGGFVVNHDEAAADRIVKDETPLPYPFSSGDELLALCATAQAEHRRDHAGQRAGLAQRKRDTRRSVKNLGCHAQLYQARIYQHRGIARWPQGAPARTVTLP